MKERPILMNAEMVRATLEDRKTQTRRVINPQPDLPDGWNTNSHVSDIADYCPFGKPGERIWVRETCWIWGRWYKNGKTATGRQKWQFKANRTVAAHFDPNNAQNAIKGTPRERSAYWKRPSIFMPRRACRLLLDVKLIRVERLNDISDTDAIAEGIRYRHELDPCGSCHYQSQIEPNKGFNSPVAAFRELWDSLNASRGYGWDTNPWCWIIEFERVKDGESSQ